MNEVRHLHTVFENPIFPAPSIVPGRVVLLLGVSSRGTYGEAIYVRDFSEMEKYYGSGPLVTAYKDASDAGALNIFVYRLNRDNEDALTDEEFYNRLEEAYENTENVPVHILVPVGAYLDSEYPFHQQLKEACIRRRNSFGSIGVLGVSPLTNQDNLGEYIDMLMNIESMGRKVFDPDDEFADETDGLICAVAHDIDSNGVIRSAASAVAGLISSLEPRVSITNKALRGAFDLAFEYSEEEQGVTDTVTFSKSSVRLSRIPRSRPVVVDASTSQEYLEGETGDYMIDYDTGEIYRTEYTTIPDGGTVNVTYRFSEQHSLEKRGYITLKRTIRRGVVPYRGVTAAHPQSVYHSLASTRIALEIFDRVNSIRLELLGEPLTQAHIDSFNEVLDGILQSKVEDETILGYRTRISYSKSEQIVTINLSIVPIGEIKSIGFVVRLEV